MHFLAKIKSKTIISISRDWIEFINVMWRWISGFSLHRCRWFNGCLCTSSWVLWGRENPLGSLVSLLQWWTHHWDIFGLLFHICSHGRICPCYFSGSSLLDFFCLLSTTVVSLITPMELEFCVHSSTANIGLTSYQFNLIKFAINRFCSFKSFHLTSALHMQLFRLTVAALSLPKHLN